jgi:hypothetical protein
VGLRQGRSGFTEICGERIDDARKLLNRMESEKSQLFTGNTHTVCYMPPPKNDRPGFSALLREYQPRISAADQISSKIGVKTDFNFNCGSKLGR